MAEIVISIMAKLGEYSMGPILRGARYLFRFNQFVEEVGKVRAELESTRAQVVDRKEVAAQTNEQVTVPVNNWLNNVETILQEVQKLQREAEEGRKNCFNVSRRYSLAKQMGKKAKQMMELNTKSKFEPFSLRIPLSHSPYIPSEKFEDFNSRKLTFNSLLTAIKDEKKKMIGLYGMGGSGKTTLAKEVRQKVVELKLFDNVIMSVVSRPLNVEKIQKDIAEQIGLTFWEEIQQNRAQRLLSRLQNEKIFIILDDVWDYLSLPEIGIPLSEGCCILLTTRIQGVCNLMQCDSRIPMPLLTKEEAWVLFKKHANITSDLSNEFDVVGRHVVDECKELPIAIVTVGSTLKEKRIIEVWKSALSRLKRSQPLDIADVSLRSHFACLELSYDYLQNPIAKSLLLLCSMFPEDHEIHKEDLIRFGKETLEVDEISDSMEDVRREIVVAIDILLGSSLLMPTDKQSCVKMHDLVRDVALWIAKKKHQSVLVDSHEVSKMLNKNESVKDTKIISLWNLEKNFKFSIPLLCPTLEILQLHSQKFIEDLRGIEALKVLALKTFSFEWFFQKTITQWSMPQSIVSLTNLCTLCLRGIALGDISFLGKLKGLEILDLRGSSFNELPIGIVDMKMLKLLDMFGCLIEKNPYEVIGRCEQLQELYLWDKASTIPKNFSTSELKRYVICDSRCNFSHIGSPLILEYLYGYAEALRALSIKGSNVSLLSSSMKDLIFRADILWLENCRWDNKDVNSKIKHLVVSRCPDKRIIVDDDDINILQTEQVFSHLITLRLSEMNGLERVFRDSAIGCSLQMLQELYIEDCPQLRTIFTLATITSLPELRKLYVISCHEWESIFSANSLKNLSASSPNVCFPKLSEIEIRFCDKVKWVFYYSLACHCPSLENLKIYYCSELEGFIDGEADEESTHTYGGYRFLFPKLNTLSLTRLLKLRQIFPDFLHTQDCPEKNENDGGVCVNLELCNLYLGELPVLEYIWKNPTQIVSLHRLEQVSLSKCTKLRTIFSLAIIPSLLELRKIYVEYCDEWEGIICEDSLRNPSTSSPNVCFPKLSEIQIKKCNKVKRVFSYSLASHCPSLETLYIYDCFELERVVEAEEQTTHTYEGSRLLFPKLNILHLESLPKLTQIFPGFDYKESLHHIKDCSKKNENDGGGGLWVVNSQTLMSLDRLEQVRLVKCPKLRAVFTPAVIPSLPELKKLDVRECNEWEGIFSGDQDSLKSLHASSPNNVCFPELSEIYIEECTKVKRAFSYSLASHCPSLQKLHIQDCGELEGVVEGEADEEATNTYGGYGYHLLFPRLNTLHLRRLPKLRQIFPDFEYKESLRHMQDYPKKNENDGGVQVVNSELHCLDLIELLELEYIWNGASQIVSFHKLGRVRLSQCPKLRTIFSNAIIPCLPKLRNLDVRHCNEWEGIMCEDSVKSLSASSPNVCFPKLSEIHIQECNKVKWMFFYSLACHCPSLAVLNLSDCCELKGVVQGFEGEAFADDRLLFPKLNTLDLKNLPKFEGIISEDSLKNLFTSSPNVCFPKLSEIRIGNCSKVKRVFSYSLASHCPSLRKLWIWECSELEGIVEGFEGETNRLLFPKLNNLYLISLPKLRQIYPGYHKKNMKSLECLIISNCPNIHSGKSPLQ